MPLRRPEKRPAQEPTIALINVVFLMLIFFMVAGALAPPLDGRVTLARTTELEGRPPPDALVLLADGSLSWRGMPINVTDAAALAEIEDGHPVLRVVPDRDLPAARLMEQAAALSAAGVGQLYLVTERGIE